MRASTPKFHPRLAPFSHRPRLSAAPHDEPGRRCRCERLEPRFLLAASLPEGFVESQYATGFNTPVTMEFAPDGRLFVGEKAGTIRIVQKDGALLPESFLSLRVDTYRERGLEGFALDPDFQNNGHLYVYYTRADNNSSNRLSRFTVRADDPNRVDPASEVVLLDNIPTPTGYHNGGSMHFGTDGMLYLGIGDGGSLSGDVQNMTKLSGKILRLNVSAYPNLIPADNPFVNSRTARKEIFAVGFRNPFTSAIDPRTGSLFVNDVGTDQWEEVNHVVARGNYGWPDVEGASNDKRFIGPIHTYPHDAINQAAVTGGTFYRTNQFPKGYRGGYFFADYTQGWIKFLKPSRTNRVFNFATGAEGPIDLDVGPDGSLYYLSAFGMGYSGENRPVMKITHVGNANRPPRAVAAANVTAGATPLAVNFTAQGSSDPDNDRLTYSWDFGDGSDKATGRDVSHTFNANGTYNVLLTVTDSRGASNAAAPIPITVGSQAPTAVITAPRNRGFYRAGQTINFAGRGTDPEDGNLPASAYEWSVVFHHLKHTHPFLESIPDVQQGSFTIPLTGEIDSRQGYAVHLTVTDSDGLKHTSSLYLRPRKAAINLETNIPGLTLHLDDQPQTAPTSFVGVVGMERKLSAPLTQTLNGKTYEFVSWSDGQAAEHTISTPGRKTTYTAEYREVTNNRRRLRPMLSDTPIASSSAQPEIVVKSSNLAALLQSGYFSQKSIPDPLHP